MAIINNDALMFRLPVLTKNDIGSQIWKYINFTLEYVLSWTVKVAVQ